MWQNKPRETWTHTSNQIFTVGVRVKTSHFPFAKIQTVLQDLPLYLEFKTCCHSSVWSYFYFFNQFLDSYSGYTLTLHGGFWDFLFDSVRSLALRSFTATWMLSKTTITKEFYTREEEEEESQFSLPGDLLVKINVMRLQLLKETACRSLQECFSTSVSSYSQMTIWQILRS